MINYLNFLRESNIRRVYPDDKWVSGNWRVCLSGSEKEFAVINLSSYLLASATVFAGKYRMRELRYTGRNSSDMWASRSSRMGHIYSFDVSRDFSQRTGFFFWRWGGGDRRVKNASYFARFIYTCLIFHGCWIYHRLSFPVRDTDICVPKH